MGSYRLCPLSRIILVRDSSSRGLGLPASKDCHSLSTSLLGLVTLALENEQRRHRMVGAAVSDIF